MRHSLVLILFLAMNVSALVAQCEEAGDILPSADGEIYLVCSEESKPATLVQTGEPLARIRVRKSAAIMASSDRKKREYLRGVIHRIHLTPTTNRYETQGYWLSPRFDQ